MSIVYVSMSADIIHHGHIKIIEEGVKLSEDGNGNP